LPHSHPLQAFELEDRVTTEPFAGPQQDELSASRRTAIRDGWKAWNKQFRSRDRLLKCSFFSSVGGAAPILPWLPHIVSGTTRQAAHRHVQPGKRRTVPLGRTFAASHRRACSSVPVMRGELLSSHQDALFAGLGMDKLNYDERPWVAASSQSNPWLARLHRSRCHFVFCSEPTPSLLWGETIGLLTI